MQRDGGRERKKETKINYALLAVRVNCALLAVRVNYALLKRDLILLF